ncbi:MAG: TetR family transcriptional regulator [Deltaproteobacteria bacterium]
MFGYVEGIVGPPQRSGAHMRENRTRERILERATNLFYQHGFVGASIRDIAQAVGVANAKVYAHFKNKDHILLAIITDIGEIILERQRNIISEDHDAEECFKRMIQEQVCLVKEKRKEIKIYLDEQHQLPRNLRKQSLEQHRELYELFRQKLEELKADRLIRDLDITVITFCVSGMIFWAYRWYREGGPLTIEEIADQIIRVFFDGVSATPRPVVEE